MKHLLITRNALMLTFAALFLSGCSKNDVDREENTRISVAFSVFVDNGSVLVSGFSNENSTFTNKYWIESANADSVSFVSKLKNGSLYHVAVDDQYRIVFGYKTLEGKNDLYKFEQGNLNEDGRMFYYKNNSIVSMDTVALGKVSSVYTVNDKPYFAGYFGKIGYSEVGEFLLPETPFFWDGGTTIIKLPLPDGSTFHGVSSLFVSMDNDIYVAGLTGFPMYWKNSLPVVLDERYGEVRQILVSGTDVYAAGLFNKHNSNSTGHTACYWKNGKLIELDDDAQAYGIYISGTDVYVSGSFGKVPSQYKACYWKNGIRLDLPD